MSTIAPPRPFLDRPDQRPAGHPVLAWCGQVLGFAAIIAVSAIVTTAIVVPRVGGATPYTILTGSMTPGMPPGTLVVVKPRPVGEIRIGDVVTYQIESGRPAVVTHRVVGLGTNARGERTLVTKGDANEVADATPVRPMQVRGVRWYAVPYLGQVNSLLTGQERAITLLVSICALLGYAALMFTGAVRDRRARARAAA